MSTYVGFQPMFHPITGRYRIDLSVDAEHPVTLSWPESASFEDLPLADVRTLSVH